MAVAKSAAHNRLYYSHCSTLCSTQVQREHPEMEEELICLRAIRDVNVPKFLLDDLKLFRGIVSDLFPGVKEDPVDYGSLLTSIQESVLGLRKVLKRKNMY